MTARTPGPRSVTSPVWTSVVVPPIQRCWVSTSPASRRMDTKASTSPWISPIATTRLVPSAADC